MKSSWYSFAKSLQCESRELFHTLYKISGGNDNYSCPILFGPWKDRLRFTKHNDVVQRERWGGCFADIYRVASEVLMEDA